MVHSKAQAATATPGHEKRLALATTAQLKAQKKARAVHWVEKTSKEENTGAEEKGDSDSDITMASSDPITAASSDSSMSTIETLSDLASEPLAQNPPRQTMAEIIHRLPIRGEDTEYEAFLYDAYGGDTDIELEEDSVEGDSSDIDAVHGSDDITENTTHSPSTHILGIMGNTNYGGGFSTSGISSLGDLQSGLWAPPPKPKRGRKKAVEKDGDAEAPHPKAPRQVKKKKSAATLTLAQSDGEPDGRAVLKRDADKERKQKEKEALKEFKLVPKSKGKNPDHLTPHLLGYALLSIGLDKAGPDCPTLIPGPLQRTKNAAQVKKLAVGGWDGLDNTAPKHMIAITIDPAFVEMSSLSADPSADLKPLVFTAAACHGEMCLQAGTHRVGAARSCFEMVIGIHERLTRAEVKAAENGLKPDDAETLKLAQVKLRTEVVWGVAVYTQKVDINPEKYYALMLYLNTNNNLPSLPDRDVDKFNTVCQALGYTGSDSAIHVKRWAADQSDSAVQRLVNRFPDVIEWFAELHKMAAFRMLSIKPADLLETKKVGWGLYVRYIEGLINVIHFIASPLDFPRKDDNSIDILGLNSWLTNYIIANPEFEYSQRIVDIVVDGSRGLFVTHLQEQMAFFGIRPSSCCTIWKTAFKTYAKAILQQVEGWVAADLLINGGEPLTKKDQQIMSLVKGKLLLIFKFSLITDGYPLLPSFAGAGFPLLCPELLICLRNEIESIRPLLQLGRMRETRDVAILSDTEQLFRSLEYFHMRASPQWATSTHAVLSAVIPDGSTLSAGRYLKEACMEMTSLMFGLRGCELASIFPGLARKVWPELKDLPEAVENDHEWADEVPKAPDAKWMKKYLALMMSWAGSCPGARQDADLRLIQKCPVNIAADLPACFLDFLQRTPVNWMTAATGLNNAKNVVDRFLKVLAYELFVTATAHGPLLDSDPGLAELRDRLKEGVRDIPGLEHFDWWYDGGNHDSNAPSRLVPMGDQFVLAAGRRITHEKRVTATGEYVTKFFKGLSHPDRCGIALPRKTPKDKQEYSMDPALWHVLEGVGPAVYEIVKDVQAGHIGLADFDLANDLVRVDHRNASKATFPGFAPTTFASVADTRAFFTASDVQYPILRNGGRQTRPKKKWTAAALAAPYPPYLDAPYISDEAVAHALFPNSQPPTSSEEMTLVACSSSEDGVVLVPSSSQPDAPVLKRKHPDTSPDEDDEPPAKVAHVDNETDAEGEDDMEMDGEGTPPSNQLTG
ncbi:hypothetical protein C8R45DRAFT_948539 [Mycena sanguinolenta]|nr:hypothetical protein C8R45DRAFT_948539 [Mycena sanguinolenta]